MQLRYPSGHGYGAHAHDERLGQPNEAHNLAEVAVAVGDQSMLMNYPKLIR